MSKCSGKGKTMKIIKRLVVEGWERGRKGGTKKEGGHLEREGGK